MSVAHNQLGVVIPGAMAEFSYASAGPPVGFSSRVPPRLDCRLDRAASELVPLALIAIPDADRSRARRGGRGPSMVVPPIVRPVRLTRRGVAATGLVVALLGAALLIVAHSSLAGSTLAGSQMQPAARTGIGGGFSTVVVQRGDSLWSIARQLAPDRDPRAVVEQLRSVNRLPGVALWPGQVLRVS